MHAIDYILRKGEKSEALSVQSSPGGGDHKKTRPLGVTGWSQGNVPCGPFLHQVFMGRMHLQILAKLGATVLVVVNS